MEIIYWFTARGYSILPDIFDAHYADRALLHTVLLVVQKLQELHQILV